MIRWFFHALYSLAALLLLSFGFVRARIYFYATLQRKLSLPHLAVLNSKEKRRLQHYFYGVSYLGIVFNTLLGRFRSRTEKMRFADMAALAAFFDDLTDRSENHLPSPHNAESYAAVADERGIALHWLRKVEKSLPESAVPSFRGHLDRVFQLETRETQQTAIPIPFHQLEAITAEKGGHSVLLFRCLLDKNPSEKETRALAQFGALLQLCDDVFDLWSDRQAGIQTLATRYAETGQIAALSAFFEAEVQKTRALFWAVNGLRCRVAWAEVCFIVNITRVCLHHYAELLKKHGTLPLDERRHMVVDMERWAARRRAIVLTLKYPG